MKLIRAEIIEFGGLRDRTFDFSGGMNIIEGYNESGKSTLLSFIKFMLYGMPARAGTETDSRERYLSWSGGRAAGSLTFAADGRTWRVEREGSLSHTARGDSYNEKPVLIIDAATGTVAHKGKCPGELFLGINAAVFNSTCAVSQLSAQNINSPELGNCIENILQSADESISLSKVCKRLDDARKELIYKNGRGGRIYELQCQEEQLSERRERAKENAQTILRLEAQVAQCRTETGAAMDKQTQLSELWEKSEAWLILGRFEQVGVRENEIAELERQLSELRRDSFPDGFIPTVPYVTQLSDLSHQLEQASAALSQAELRRSQHVAIPTYDAHKAEIAERIMEKGGSKQGLLSRYIKLRQSLNTARTFGMIALLCGLVALAGGGLSAALLDLAGFGIALAALGGVGAVIGIILMAGIKKKVRRIADLLAELDLDTDSGEGALSRYLDECIAAQVAKTSYLAALDALTQIRDAAAEALRQVSDRVCEAMAPSGAATQTDSTSQLATQLAVRMAACRDFISAEADLCRRLELSRQELERLKQSLTAYDEGFIRSRAGNLERDKAISAEQYSAMREQFSAELRAAYDKQTAIERQIAYYEGQETTPTRIAAQLHVCRDEIDRLSLRAEALILANKAMEDASGKLRRGFTPLLRREAGKLLAPLTDSRYSDVGISDDFALSLVAEGGTRSVSGMSGGTRDASYLALRLALTRLLCPDTMPPVLLDEALSQLDERRAKGLLTMLSEWCDEGNQCLIFTCHTREARLAHNFNHIKL